MTFLEFCRYNGNYSGKQFVMLDFLHFPPQEVVIDFNIVMFTTKGSAVILVDGVERKIERRYMSVFREGQHLECLSMSEDYSCKTLLIGGNLGKALSISDVFLTLFILDESPVLKVTTSYAAATSLFFDALSKVVRFQDNPYQEECLISLMRAFFYSTGYYLYKVLDLKSESKELQDFSIKMKSFDEDSPVRKFIHLVEKNAGSKHPLSFYAGQMNYHPKYLSNLVKRQTGRSGQEIIDSYLTLRIVAKLSYSDKSIKEISNEMDFPSQSDFGKFFKRMTGYSPLQYKKSRFTKRHG